MHKFLAVFAVAFITAAPVVASDKTDVMATVKQFVVDFNKGDAKSAVAACADQTSIIDEFPPFEWHGAGACKKWMDGLRDGCRRQGKRHHRWCRSRSARPRHVDVAGDRAYVVIPSNYAFKQKGKPVKETGSMFTFALQKGAAGWRITGLVVVEKLGTCTRTRGRIPCPPSIFRVSPRLSLTN